MDPIGWIANLPGPEFLVFYWILSALVIAACAVWSRRLDPLPPFVQIPTQPDARTDPYELAWLRGGTAWIRLTALFSLRHQRSVAVNSDSVYRVPGGVRPSHPVEQVVYDALPTPRKMSELASDRVVAHEFERIGSGYHDKYVRAGLATSPGERARAWAAILVGLAVVLGTGGFKLAVALSRGRTNVLFLILTAVAVAVAIVVVCRPRRLNARGRAHLKALVQTFRPWGESAAVYSGNDAMLPLYVGVLGTGILAGTQYEDFKRAAARSNAGDAGGGSSCGSSCSSASSSCGSGGSSCGGGGGCGGGGCGGCGGG